MKIHEYQAKQIFAKLRRPDPQGATRRSPSTRPRPPPRSSSPRPAARSSSSRRRSTPAAAARAAASRSPRAAPPRRASSRRRSSACSSSRTRPGPRGRRCARLYIEQGLDIARELYLGAVVDRDRAARRRSWPRPRAASRSRRSPPRRPEKILTVHVDPARRPRRLPGARARLRPRARHGKETRRQVRRSCMRALYEVVRRRGLLALRDQPADRHRRRATCWRSTPRSTSTTTPLFRHPDVAATCATSTRRTRPSSRRKAAGLSYVVARRQHRLPGQRRRPGDGTMDIIKHFGGHGGAGQLPRRRRRRQQGAGHRRRSRSSSPSPKVKAILVNIFGGIMKCDIIAARRRRRGQGARPQGAAGRAPRGDERRARAGRSSSESGLADPAGRRR